jgi:hypothetical protein
MGKGFNMNLRRRLRHAAGYVYVAAKYYLPGLFSLILFLFVLYVISNVPRMFDSFSNGYLQYFPEKLNHDTAVSLLSAILQVDGILLGLFGLVFAAILNMQQTQIAQLRAYSSAPLETLSDSTAKRIRKLMSGLKVQFFLLGLFALSLIYSMFQTFILLANTNQEMQREQLTQSISPLFAGVIIFFLAIYLAFAWTGE